MRNGQGRHRPARGGDGVDVVFRQPWLVDGVLQQAAEAVFHPEVVATEK